jgi:hypothetical protein
MLTKASTQNVRMHILLDSDKTVTYYMKDESSRQGGCPMTDKTAIVLTTTKMLSRVPEWPDPKTD